MALVIKNLPANAENLRDAGLIPGLGRSLGEGNGSPLQYSHLGNPIDRGAWRAGVCGVARVRNDLATKQQQSIERMVSQGRKHMSRAVDFIMSEFSVHSSHHCKHQCVRLHIAKVLPSH